jgi:hypothetical protein
MSKPYLAHHTSSQLHYSPPPVCCCLPVQYVVVRQDGRLEWEPGENRCIHVPPPGLAAALEAAKKAVSKRNS